MHSIGNKWMNVWGYYKYSLFGSSSPVFIGCTMFSIVRPHQYPASIYGFYPLLWWFSSTTLSLLVFCSVDSHALIVTRKNIYRFSHETGTKTHDLPYSESVYMALLYILRYVCVVSIFPINYAWTQLVTYIPT